MPRVMEVVAYSFDELSEEAKQRAIDEHRDMHIEHHEWWYAVYEDAVECAKRLGIEIAKKNLSGHPSGRLETAIYFSGFWSQGDGASFEGYYSPKPDAVEAIKEHTFDPVLIDIAERLTAAQIKLRLSYGVYATAKITVMNTRYCHSGTMAAEIRFPEDDLEQIDTFSDYPFLAIFRDFADWIYRQLEAEHDHLTSDETITDSLRNGGYEFEEDGSII